MSAALILKPGRDRSLLRGHPWIFSGAVAKIEADGKVPGGREPQAGDTVEIRNASGKRLASAAYSPRSQIRARVWTFDPDEDVGSEFLCGRVERAVQLREMLSISRHTNALRLVHGESDGLPGLIVDRYADVLVVQFLAVGVECWREAIFAALARSSGCDAIFERSDAEVRALEGLSPRLGWERGGRDSARCPIIEYGLNFRVDVEQGQKTGFFLDQRENRQRLRALASNRAILDCFCYTGGFALAAVAGGAKQVLAVDSSAAALEVARENLAANQLDISRIVFEQADVFARLRSLRDQDARFDMIILDPPKFAPTAAQARNAARAYKDINLLAFKLLAPGGLLATFSCSGGVPAELFQSIVAGAARDAGVSAKIIEKFCAAPDHPVALEFPEGAYLKGLLVVRA